MSVATLCSREIVTIDAQASLQDAAVLMGEQHVGALVVVAARGSSVHVVGIVTDRDLTLEALGRSDVPGKQIGQLAKSPPVSVRGSASVSEAVAAMEKAGVRRILVTEDDGGVIGLVSADDLLFAIAEELEGLARAVRQGLSREESERKIVRKPAQPRVVFPQFGTAGEH